MPEHRVKELFFMTRALDQALTSGIADWAADTDRHTAWLRQDPMAWHVFAGTMLVGLFAFAEGRLGRWWWDNLRSETAKRDLTILWKARNAFVHADSELLVNSFNSAEDVAKFEDYCTRLSDGEFTDDRDNQYPVFMTLQGSTIRFNEEAINQFRALFEVAFQAERLGRLSP